MRRHLFGQSLNQFVIMLVDEFLRAFCYRRIVDGIFDVVAELGNLRPQRHVQAQALRFRALGIRHTHAPMDFELLDVNAIDHDRLNFGEKRIGRRAPILIVQGSERQAQRTTWAQARPRFSQSAGRRATDPSTGANGAHHSLGNREASPRRLTVRRRDSSGPSTHK